MAKNTISLEHTSAGIPVITETIPGAINSGYMIAVNTGSRDETSDIFGLSHLLEHVVFRATKSRTSFQMSKEIEGAGGEMNAFTAKEMTAFYAVTIKDTAKVAQDIVADIVTNPLIADNDTEMEKKIVLQEISMVENQPTSYIHDLFDEAIWKGHELAQSEAGTREIVKSLKNTDLRKYYEEKYKVPNFKVFACGAVDPADTVEWAEQNLDALRGDKATKRTKPQVTGASYTYHKRKEEHCYVGMGFRTFEPTNKDLPALRLLSAILGAGSSSRLFQSVREEKALVYSVYNSVSQFTDASTFATFMSSTEENVLESIETTAKTYRLLKENGLTENELQRSKNLLKGAFARQMESTSDRLYSMARNTMLIGTPKSIEERLEAFDAVTEEDVMRVAQKVLDPKGLNIVMFGNEVKSMKDFDVAQLDF